MESNRHGLYPAEIRYARNGGVAIAYQVVGEGDVDLVYVPEWTSNLVYWWEYPRWRNFYLRLARSFRLILFDKRGTGLSDHGGQFATLETRMEDLHAVLDAAGSSNPVIFGAHEGSTMAVLFAASYPERTRALVLFHARAKGSTFRTDAESARQYLAGIREGWASGSGATRSSSRCGLRSLRTRTIDAGSRTPSVSERAPPSHTRSTARLTRRTFAMCCRRCTSRRSSSTAPCRRRRPRRWTRRPGYRARVRCACPAPTRPRSSSRTRSQTRSSASSRARKPHLSPRPCSPPLCSPTSSAQRITPQASATATGAT